MKNNNDALLHFRSHFMHRFFSHLSNTDTHKQAYYKTEEDHKLVFGKWKYKGYESFKVAKSRYMSNLKKVK